MRPGNRGGRRGGKKAGGTGGQSADAWGRSRGGFGTKVHAAVSPPGRPVALELAGPQAAASPRRPGPIAGVRTAAVLADKGYDPDANRAAVRRQGAEPCIPPRRNRTDPIAYDRHLYRERNVVDRFFARVEPYRRVATRYDEKAANVPGLV